MEPTDESTGKADDLVEGLILEREALITRNGRDQLDYYQMRESIVRLVAIGLDVEGEDDL